MASKFCFESVLNLNLLYLDGEKAQRVNYSGQFLSFIPYSLPGTICRVFGANTSQPENGSTLIKNARGHVT